MQSYLDLTDKKLILLNLTNLTSRKGLISYLLIRYFLLSYMVDIKTHPDTKENIGNRKRPLWVLLDPCCHLAIAMLHSLIGRHILNILTFSSAQCIFPVLVLISAANAGEDARQTLTLLTH